MVYTFKRTRTIVSREELCINADSETEARDIMESEMDFMNIADTDGFSVLDVNTVDSQVELVKTESEEEFTKDAVVGETESK